MILGKTIAELNLRDIGVFSPIVGRGWARLTVGDWMHQNGQDQQLTLTVGENGHYTLKVKSSPSMVWSASVCGVYYRDIKAKTKETQFVLSQRTELEAINALQETFTVSERSKESGMLELTMTGDDPQLITRILNSIANNYLQQNIARHRRFTKPEFLQRYLKCAASWTGRKKNSTFIASSAIRLKPKPF